MDDIGTHLVAVLVDEIHVKLLCQQGIPLDGDHGIFLAVHIPGIDVDLGTVESGFAHILHIGNLQFLHDVPHMLLGLFPHLGFPDILFPVIRIPFGQMVGHILLHSQGLQAMFCQRQTFLELLHHLVGSDNQMTLGNGKLAHPGQSVHLAGILVAEQRGSLAVAQGQIAVGMLGGFIHIVLERAGHGTQGKNFLVLLLVSHDKHTVLVVVPVAGNLVQVGFGHQGRLGTDIAPLIVLQVLNPTLHGLDDLSPSGHQQRQPLADYVHSGEQFHLPAQFVVIPAFGILHALQMCRQFLLARIGRAVDALQAGFVGIPSPVGHGGGSQFKCLHPLGVHQVRACAQVNKLSLPVKGYLRILGQILNQFHLVRFALLFHETDSLFPGK